jgi:hypothetical protein
MPISRSILVPTGKPVGYIVGSLVGITDIFDYVVTSGSPFSLYADGSIYISDENYFTLVSYPYTFDATQIPYDGGSVDPLVTYETFTIEINAVSIISFKSNIVYVDSEKGDNSNTGDYNSPLSSISLAISSVRGAGTILLYSGNYGLLELSNLSVTIKSLKGEIARFYNIKAINGGSFNFIGLYITGSGINANNSSSNSGTISVRNCIIPETIEASLTFSNYKYVSVTSNLLVCSRVYFKIEDVTEAVVASNLIASKADEGEFKINRVGQVAIVYNTIDNITTMFLDDVSSVSTYGVAWITITEELLSQKKIVFTYPFDTNSSGVPTIAINMLSGTSLNIGDPLVEGDGDFTYESDNVIVWEGRGLDVDVIPTQEERDSLQEEYPNLDVSSMSNSEVRIMNGAFELGDKIRVIYTYLIAGEDHGTESTTFLVSSNNITNADLITFTSGMYAFVDHNNFWQSYLSSLPTGEGNIYVDPEYNSDYSLGDSSPSRFAGNSNLFPKSSLGPSFKYYVPSFQEITDLYNSEKSQKLKDPTFSDPETVSPDIGAIENLSYVPGLNSSSDVYFGRKGYDNMWPGTELNPVNTLSKAIEINKNLIALTTLGATGSSLSETYVEESYLISNGNEISFKDSSSNEIPDTFKLAIQIKDPIFSDQDESVVYVSPVGNDNTGDGTELNPYATVEVADAKSPSVMNICILGGEYRVETFKCTSGKRILFKTRRADERENLLIRNFDSSLWVTSKPLTTGGHAEADSVELTITYTP